MASLHEKIGSSQASFGTWQVLNTSHGAELLARAGFDWVIIDTQHGGISEPDLLPLLQVFSGYQVPAFVRVNWLNPAQIMRAVDLGAAGVIVPMVNTAEEAALAVGAMRYPPAGFRSFGPVRNYYAASEGVKEPCCMAMIETVEALENLEAIAATPGLDGLFVGPIDLALSMGFEFSLDMPQAVLSAVEAVANVCKRRGLIAGSVALGPSNALDQLKLGIRFLSSASDAQFINREAKAEREHLHEIARSISQD